MNPRCKMQDKRGPRSDYGVPVPLLSVTLAGPNPHWVFLGAWIRKDKTRSNCTENSGNLTKASRTISWPATATGKTRGQSNQEHRNACEATRMCCSVSTCLLQMVPNGTITTISKRVLSFRPQCGVAVKPCRKKTSYCAWRFRVKFSTLGQGYEASSQRCKINADPEATKGSQSLCFR